MPIANLRTKIFKMALFMDAVINSTAYFRSWEHYRGHYNNCFAALGLCVKSFQAKTQRC